MQKKDKQLQPAPVHWPYDIMSLPLNEGRISWQSSSPALAPPLLTAPAPSPGTSVPEASRGQVFPSSVLPPSLPLSLPQNEHSKLRQLAKSSLPASPMHVDSHLSCPAVMEPWLRASLRRIHAPKSIKLCVSKGGDSIFPAQLNGTVRLRFCLRGVGRGELWSQRYAHFGAVQVWLMNHKPKPGSSLLSSLRCRTEIR